MKYSRTKNNNQSEVAPIDKLNRLTNISNKTSILVYDINNGTALIDIETLIALLDIRYEQRKYYEPSELIEAIDKIFDTNSEYDEKYINANKDFIEDRLEDIQVIHNKEIIDAIEDLFAPKK